MWYLIFGCLTKIWTHRNKGTQNIPVWIFWDFKIFVLVEINFKTKIIVVCKTKFSYKFIPTHGWFCPTKKPIGFRVLITFLHEKNWEKSEDIFCQLTPISPGIQFCCKLTKDWKITGFCKTFILQLNTKIVWFENIFLSRKRL